MSVGLPMLSKLAALLSATAVTMAAGSLTAARPAAAAFPGGNGKIAFDDGFDISTIDPDGSAQAQLTSSGDAVVPAWSPDGNRVAFLGVSGGVWVMNADGSDPTQLTTNPGDDYPSWSPDGTRIAFVRGGQLFLVDADGSDPTPLTTSGGADTEPDWSPDGQKIAFTSDRGSSIEIWTMNADGSGQTELTSGSDPSWQPLTSSTRSVADLRLRMAGPRRIGPGDPVTYAIRIRNEGPAVAGDVIVTDRLPAGTSFVRVRVGRGSCQVPDPASATLSCSLGSMGDGSVRTIIVVCQSPSTDGLITNTVTAAGSTPDPDLHDNSATVVTTVH